MSQVVRLMRPSTRSLLTISFADIGINFSMSKEAILSHANAMYQNWIVLSIEENGSVRTFDDLLEIE